MSSHVRSAVAALIIAWPILGSELVPPDAAAPAVLPQSTVCSSYDAEVLIDVSSDWASKVFDAQVLSIFGGVDVITAIVLCGIALFIVSLVLSTRMSCAVYSRAYPANAVLEGKRQMLDELIASFSCYAQRLHKGPSPHGRRAALQRLRVLIDLLEMPTVNQTFRAANWHWLCAWDRGQSDPVDVRRRCAVVFPTICAAAQVQRSENYRSAADVSASLSYLSGWCADFLERDDVKKMISTPRHQSTTPSEKTGSHGSSSEDDEALSGDDKAEDAIEFGEFRRRRFVGEGHCWDNADATEMMLRGARYLEDKRKVHSRCAMLELVDAHLLKTDNEMVHYSQCPRGRVLQMRNDGDMRFFFVVNFRLPPIQFALTWAVPPKADWFAKPEGRLFQKFREMSDADRRNRLKILLKVVEGPWIVKQGVPDRPGVVGRKIEVDYFQNHDHLEVSINCISSQAGRRIVNLLTGAAKHFSMELFIILEGQCEDELPERILAGLSMFHGDLAKIATC